MSPRPSLSAEGFDLRWRNLVDAGSPIVAAHYRIEGGGGVVVPAKTVGGQNPQAVSSIEAPNDRGQFTLRLWLADAEGNVGAPVTAPLSYECVRSTVGGGGQLSAPKSSRPTRLRRCCSGACRARADRAAARRGSRARSRRGLDPPAALRRSR